MEAAPADAARPRNLRRCSRILALSIEEERKKANPAVEDEADVEAHGKQACIAEGSEPPDEKTERRESDEPAVEAHRFKSG